MATEVFRQVEEEIDSLAKDIRSWEDVDPRIPFVVFSHQREGVSGAATTLPRPSRIRAEKGTLTTEAYWDTPDIRYEVISTRDNKRMVYVGGKSPDSLLQLSHPSAGRLEMYEALRPRFDKEVPEPHIDFQRDTGVNLTYIEDGQLDSIDLLFREAGIGREKLTIGFPKGNNIEKNLPRRTGNYFLEGRSQVIFEVRSALRGQVSLHVKEIINPTQSTAAVREAELGRFPTTFQPQAIRLKIGAALRDALMTLHLPQSIT